MTNRELAAEFQKIEGDYCQLDKTERQTLAEILEPFAKLPNTDGELAKLPEDARKATPIIRGKMIEHLQERVKSTKNDKTIKEHRRALSDFFKQPPSGIERDKLLVGQFIKLFPKNPKDDELSRQVLDYSAMINSFYTKVKN
jgi:hypothetical protein